MRSFKNGFKTIWYGLKEVALCVCDSSMLAFNDALRYAWRHPVAMSLNMLLIINSVLFGVSARAERDSYGKSCYIAEQQRDSLQIIVEGFIKK